MADANLFTTSARQCAEDTIGAGVEGHFTELNQAHHRRGRIDLGNRRQRPDGIGCSWYARRRVASIVFAHQCAAVIGDHGRAGEFVGTDKAIDEGSQGAS